MREERRVVGERITELWSRLSVQQSVELDRWQWWILVVLVGILVIPRATWRLTGLYSTLVHELGHVISALFTGRFVTGLRLGWDHSGEVVSRGRGKLSVIVSGVLGYPAPIWVAAGLLAAAASGYTGLALAVYALLFIVALIFVRNLAALIICVASAVLALGIIFIAPVDALIYVALLIAGFLLAAGTRDCIKLISVHTWRRADLENSDAYLIAQATGSFATLWLLVILALAGAGGWVAALNLVRIL